MRIEDIKDRDLRELAQLRAGTITGDLDEAFNWVETEEGGFFWAKVWSGDITALEVDELAIANQRIEILNNILEYDKEELDYKTERIKVLEDRVAMLKCHVDTLELLIDFN